MPTLSIREPYWQAADPDEIIENESVRRVYLGEHFRM